MEEDVDEMREKYDLEELLKKLLREKHSFAYWRVVGNIGKELVRALLEACGYSVYPFGYESYLTHIKDKMHSGKIGRVPQLQRMPDLLVVSEEMGHVVMVVVIVRTKKQPNDVDIDKRKLEELIKFWPDSVLVVVLPKSDHVFYAEKITELKITDPEFVNFDISESPINKIFPNVDNYPEVLKELQELCKKLFSNI